MYACFLPPPPFFQAIQDYVFLEILSVEVSLGRRRVQVKDPSLLRFLVDVREADLDAKQLRDDLMTMLIAGHETTAAVLTWALYSLMACPAAAEKARLEVDTVLGDRVPGVHPPLHLPIA